MYYLSNQYMIVQLD